MDQHLIVRYAMFCDDKSGDVADERRIAELVCSLTSLKMYVEPSVQCDVTLYTLPRYRARLSEILELFKFERTSIIDVTNHENEEFAKTIVNCTPTDRICIQRMLADFSVLPTSQFRLLSELTSSFSVHRLS